MDATVLACTIPRPSIVVKHDGLYSEMRNVRACFFMMSPRECLVFSAETSERVFMMLPRESLVFVLQDSRAQI